MWKQCLQFCVRTCAIKFLLDQFSLLTNKSNVIIKKLTIKDQDMSLAFLGYAKEQKSRK